MKRIFIGLAALWGIVVVGAVVLLLARDDGADPPRDPPPPPLSCETLQTRARECEKELVKTAGELTEWVFTRRGHSAAGAAGRRLLVEGVVSGAIRDQRVRRYCRRLWDSSIATVMRLRGELARCWKHPGCEAFAACLRRVARAEEQAGRLPF